MINYEIKEDYSIIGASGSVDGSQKNTSLKIIGTKEIYMVMKDCPRN